MAAMAPEAAEGPYAALSARQTITIKRSQLATCVVQSEWWFRFCALFNGGALYRGLGERLAERERIARELHDTLLQGVQGLFLQTAAALEALPAQDSCRRALERTLERAEELLNEGRARIRDLRGDSQHSRTLVQAIALDAREIAPNTEATYSVRPSGNSQTLHPVVFDEVLLIVREALANAFIHAGASRIEAEVRYTKAALQVSVCDNGQGFDTAVLASKRWQQHWGLLGMQERARKLGGRVDIHSMRSLGTRIELNVPAAVAYLLH